MRIEDLHLRDPFVLPLPEEGLYCLFGTTGETCWGEAEGFNCYESRDLKEWEGPFPAFRRDPGFWADRHFWAPEVHRHGGRYYLFASFKAEGRDRGTQILVAEKPRGPYLPVSEGPVTPRHWECLDGTFHVDEGGRPWIIFCHEWMQIHNGAVYAMPLSPDLRTAAGRPVFLYNATDAPWVLPVEKAREGGPRFDCYVTDGPFLFRTAQGNLAMLFSSFGQEGYTLGQAYSESGAVTGPWVHDPVPLWEKDGGHGMLFKTFDGRTLLAFHRPNETPKERPFFMEVVETARGIALKPGTKPETA